MQHELIDDISEVERRLMLRYPGIQSMGDAAVRDVRLMLADDIRQLQAAIKKRPRQTRRDREWIDRKLAECDRMAADIRLLKRLVYLRHQERETA